MTGQTIGGFEIIREIGRGGMGVVYEARQASPRRTVALKILPPELAHVPQVAARFADEANRMAMLEGHPNIVTVYAAGEDHGVPYFAMQLLPGADLEEHLRREGRLYLDQAAEIVAQVAEALDFAHQRGVVHRDVKPANIMFDAQGRPQVTDFGIAKAREEYRLTQTGMTIGTPEYASPEQIKGDPVDGRSDLYSLAVVLYRAVCGQLPFAATTPMAYAVKHVSEQPLPPSSVVGDIPSALEHLIMRCLAKEPHERFSNGCELAASLRSLKLPHVKCGAAPLTSVAYLAPKPLSSQRVGAPPSRMSSAVIALVAVGALALLVGIAMVNSSQSRPSGLQAQPDARAVAMQQSTPRPPSPRPVYPSIPDGLPAAPSVQVAVPGDSEQKPATIRPANNGGDETPSLSGCRTSNPTAPPKSVAVPPPTPISGPRPERKTTRVARAYAQPANGNVFVEYEDGRKAKVTTKGGCEKVKIGPDGRTVGWLHGSDVWNDGWGCTIWITDYLMLYRDGAVVAKIDGGNGMIWDWKFNETVAEIALGVGPAKRGAQYYVLMRVSDESVLERCHTDYFDSAKGTKKPSWTKGLELGY